jgi:hypothetical protein
MNAMKLVSMKKEGGHGKDCHCCEVAPSGCSEPDYPWGMRISLEEDQVAALGMKTMPAVGAPVGIEAVAMVIGVNEEQRDGKTLRRLELQITDLAVAAAGTNKFAKLYDGDESMKD